MCLICGIESQGIDIGRETCGRGGIGTGNMMIHARLLRASLYTLLDEVYEVRRSQFAQGRKTFCSGVDSQSDIVIFDDPKMLKSVTAQRHHLLGLRTHSGTAGANMAAHPSGRTRHFQDRSTQAGRWVLYGTGV